MLEKSRLSGNQTDDSLTCLHKCCLIDCLHLVSVTAQQREGGGGVEKDSIWGHVCHTLLMCRPRSAVRVCVCVCVCV